MTRRPSLFRNPRALPVILLVGGLGFAGYYGLAWAQAPKYSAEEIDQSVEINLALDLARMGPQLRPEGEKLEQLRAMVRAEVEADLQREARSAQQRFAAGLVAMVFGLGNLVFVRLAERARAADPR